MTREQFHELVQEAIDRIPRRFARAIHNVAIVVEDEPSDELLDDMEIEEDGTILGLYQGTPLTERSGYGNTLPDRITLFQGPIEEECEDDEDEIFVAIGETLIHELGHYFGMEEHEIAPHEERWLLGEDDPDDVTDTAEDEEPRDGA